MEKLLKQENGTLIEIPTMTIPEPSQVGQMLCVIKDPQGNFALSFSRPLMNSQGQWLINKQDDFLMI